MEFLEIFHVNLMRAREGVPLIPKGLEISFPAITGY